MTSKQRQDPNISCSESQRRRAKFQTGKEKCRKLCEQHCLNKNKVEFNCKNSSNNINKPVRKNILIPGTSEPNPTESEPVVKAVVNEEILKCPNNKHSIKKAGDLCPCLLLMQFDGKVRQDVISEWHSRSEVAVDMGDFRLSRNKVFQGGQGVVYTVQMTDNHHNNTSIEEFVMKIKDRRPNQKTRSWKRDLREVFLMKELKHPFIVELKHAYLTDTFYSLVMEHGSKGSLWSMICKKGCLPPNIAAYYVSCMLSALQHVHKHHFIFRDMKAENVIIMDNYRPKLIDFGMAKAFNKPNVKNTFTNFYFAAYIAPEVYAEPKYVTEKVDSWGLGYLTLELSVGLGVFKSLPWAATKHTEPHWKFEMPKKLASKVNRDVLRFVDKCLERNPERRPTLEKMMNFQFLKSVDFRMLYALKPPDMTNYLNAVHTGDKRTTE